MIGTLVRATTVENSPPIYRWEPACERQTESVERTAELAGMRVFSRPLHGLHFEFSYDPTGWNRWAIIIRPLSRTPFIDTQ